MSSSHAASIVEASPTCGSSCCGGGGHLAASVTPQGGAEPKILYEHCVRPSGVRRNRSSSGRRLSPAPMVCCTSVAEVVVGATAACTIAAGTTADKTTQTAAATSSLRHPPHAESAKAEAQLESDTTADADEGDASLGVNGGGGGGGRQSNEEVHNTTVEDAGEASERDWSSETAVVAAAAADEASADAASLSTWPPGGGGACLLLSELPFRRRLPVPSPPPSRGLPLKRKRKGKKSLLSATATAARVVTLRQRHAVELLPRRPQQQQQQHDAVPQQHPLHHHMPLLEWSPFASAVDHQQLFHRSAISRPVRRAIRELSKFILCGVLLVLCGNLLLAAAIVLQWNSVTHEGQPGRELLRAPADDADYGDYAAPMVVQHRLY